MKDNTPTVIQTINNTPLSSITVSLVPLIVLLFITYVHNESLKVLITTSQLVSMLNKESD